jgi:hypothetical protein
VRLIENVAIGGAIQLEQTFLDTFYLILNSNANNSILYDVLLIIVYNLSTGTALYRTAESLCEYLVKMYGGRVGRKVF